MASQCYIVSGIPRGMKGRQRISTFLKSKSKAEKLKKVLDKERNSRKVKELGMQSYTRINVERC